MQRIGADLWRVQEESWFAVSYGGVQEEERGENWSSHVSNLLKWQLYEISSDSSSLNGVMLRGRIRKFGLENNIDVLTENTEDTENGVRFATLDKGSGEWISEYVRLIIDNVEIKLVQENLSNPVLSKLKVNKEERYNL